MMVSRGRIVLVALTAVVVTLLALAPASFGAITPVSPPGDRVVVGSNFVPRFTYADVDDTTGDYFLAAAITSNGINRLEKRDSANARVWLGGVGSGIAGSGTQMSITGVAVDPSAGLVYITGKNRLAAFDSSTGAFVRAWGYGVATGAATFEVCTTTCFNGLSGVGPGQFGLAGNGVTVDASGNVLVATAVNSRAVAKIMKFTSAGALVAEYDISPYVPLTLARAPRDIEVNSAGDIFVLWADGKVYRFDSSGGFIEKIGVAFGPGYISPFAPMVPGPSGLAIDQSDDHVFVGANTNNYVVEFDENGDFVQVFGIGVNPATPATFSSCSVGCVYGKAADRSGGVRGAQDIIIDPLGRLGVITHASVRDKVQWFTR
jgi:hypothetical protein